MLASHAPGDRFRSEIEHGFVLVVRPAPQRNRLESGVAPGGIGRNVMELEEATLSAAALRADKGAASLVARPHRPTNGSRDVTRTWRHLAGRSRRASRRHLP